MKILLATDGSESARAAVDFLAAFPFPSPVGIKMVTVITPVLHEEEFPGLSEHQRREFDEAQKSEEHAAHQLLAEEAGRLRGSERTVKTELCHGNPAEEIIRAADEFSADIIAVGSHGLTGIRKFLLGSVSDHVLESAHCSVLIVRKSARAPFSPAGAAVPSEPGGWRLLLAYDDSAPSRKAVELCASLALPETAEIKAITVLPLIRMFRQDIRQQLNWVWQEKKDAARKALKRVARDAGCVTPNVTVELLEAPDSSQAILDAVTQMGSDLVILGHKGKGAVKKFLLGSVTSRVAHHAGCSVLAVRAPSP